MIFASVPKLISPRGAGLGNEVFPWAKAYIASKILKCKLVEPPWLINPRGYSKELKSGIGNVLEYYAFSALPSFEMSKDIFYSTGQLDYANAVKHVQENYKIRGTFLNASGMAGGYLSIIQARQFLQKRLLGPLPIHINPSLEREVFGPVVKVGIHYRGSDFGNELPAPGTFNHSVPKEWYVDQIRSISRRLKVKPTFSIASDSNCDWLKSELEAINANYKILNGTSLQDLAELADSDLIIPSISSFSMLAIFLSEARYTWYEPHLNLIGGFYSIWGHEDDPGGGGATSHLVKSSQSTGIEFSRGIPVNAALDLSGSLLRELELQANLRFLGTDLIYYGSVRKMPNNQ